MSDQPQTSPAAAPRGRFGGAAWLLGTALVSAAVTFGLTALLINIFGHKQEARNPFFRVVELTDDTEDPAVWGKNFPQQYDGYLRTAEMRKTRFGGSEAEPRTPTSDDPREFVTHSRLSDEPQLKTMWAGYSFSKDYRVRRGHAYMLIDQMFTQRQRVKQQPGTCLNCHASTYVAYKQAGGGDLIKGQQALNKLTYQEARQHVTHPVSCIDCHDPKTMQLRVTKPAFMAGITALKAHEGVKGYDVNRDATRQELRTYVCAQCHVNYYLKHDEPSLVFPWANGLKADETIQYFEQQNFTEWEHKLTGARMLKARHPEFETWSQGTHARAGVACADCHMPYKRVGAMKVSDHHVRSPLLNIANACQTCHRVAEQELKDRVETIQQRHQQLRSLALNALCDLIADIESCRTAGATDEQLAKARDFQRKAGFLCDFIESENSVGFHAPQESARLAAQSIDWSRQGQMALRAAGLTPKVKAP